MMTLVFAKGGLKDSINKLQPDRTAGRLY